MDYAICHISLHHSFTPPLPSLPLLHPTLQQLPHSVTHLYIFFNSISVYQTPVKDCCSGNPQTSSHFLHICLILSQITLIQSFWCFLYRNKKPEFPLHTVAWVVSLQQKFTIAQVRFSRLRFMCHIHLTKKSIMEKNSFLRLQEPTIRVHDEEHC